ncbi:MAG: peptidase M28 family protein, partial [Marinilabiliales bacterium]
MKELFIVIVILLSPFVVSSQDKDSAIIADIYNEALLSGFSMNTLQYLCTEIGPRMTGTEQADKAVEYTYEVMQKLNVDSVYKQEVKVPNWNIYKRASATLYQDGKEQNLNVDAVGGSVGTSGKELKAQVVEIRSRKEIKRLGRENLEGKIVFLNQKMDATLLNPFQAYGEAAWQRVHGASEAAEYGAVAVLIRSLSLTADDYPHTGIMRYKEGVEKIPSLALSTNDANLLSRILRACPDCEIGLSLDAKWEEDTISYNVVGEIRGSKYPEEIITVGGHLDSWFNDPGAHDDGAGCVQSIEVLRIFKKLGIQPKRTIRVVMFMDE